MNSFLKAGAFFVFTSLFTSCAFQQDDGLYVGEKDFCSFAVNKYTGKGLRWDKSKFPITFYIHESVPPEAHRNFVSAVDHWNMAWEEFLIDRGLEYFPLFSIMDENTQYSGYPKNDAYNILFFVDDNFSKYGEPKIQAITAMHSSRWGVNIKDTDIIVNNKNFNYFYDDNYNEDVFASRAKVFNNRKIASSRSVGFWSRLKQRVQEWLNFLLKPFKKKKALRQIARTPARIPRNLVDFPSLMIHELGHVPGLAHFEKSDNLGGYNRMASRDGSDEIRKISSVMEPKLRDGRARRSIGEYDLNNLFCGYFENN